MHRILIADDDADSMELLREALTKPNRVLVPACNGFELIEALADGGPFDLVVSDVMMPLMDGFDVALAASRASLLTPFLFLTGLDGPALAERARKFSSATVLRKPVDVRVLREMVSELLGP